MSTSDMRPVLRVVTVGGRDQVADTSEEERNVWSLRSGEERL